MTDAIVTPAKLSPQEKQIVELMVVHNLNAFRVADLMNCTIEVLSSVLARPEVRKEIGLHLLTERKDRVAEVKANLILSLWALAAYDPADAFNDLNQPLAVREMPATLRAAIKGYKMTKFGAEITFYDRSTILLALLRHFSIEDTKKGPENEEKTSIRYYPDVEDEE